MSCAYVYTTLEECVLFIHLSITDTHARTHTYLHKSLKRIQMFSFRFKGHSLLQNYIQHQYDDLPSAIGNLLHLCWMLWDSWFTDYTVAIQSKRNSPICHENFHHARVKMSTFGKISPRKFPPSFLLSI